MTADMLVRISNERSWYEAEKCRKPKCLKVGLPEFFQILCECEKCSSWDLTEDFDLYKKHEVFGLEVKLVSLDHHFEIAI